MVKLYDGKTLGCSEYTVHREVPGHASPSCFGDLCLVEWYEALKEIYVIFVIWGDNPILILEDIKTLRHGLKCFDIS